MKNKGFTVIELVISLVILVTMGLVIGIGLKKVLNHNEIEDYESLIDKITSSADVYISNKSTISTDLYTNRGFFTIKLEDLINEGLLDDDLINPQTGERLDPEELIMISLDENGSLIFTYPTNPNNGNYLQTLNKIIQIGEEFNCFADIDTVNLGYINEEGELLQPYFQDELENILEDKITCLTTEINNLKIGTYPVKYRYTSPDGTVKEATRNYIVQDNIIPIIGDFKTETSSVGPDGWYTSLTRSIEAFDAESGIAKIKYCISTLSECDPNLDYPSSGVPFTSNEENQYLCIEASDLAGNIATKCDIGFKVYFDE